MTESKIAIHDRLRAADLWPEAATWKDARIKELRAGGMKKHDAADKAWEELGEKYPLPPPVPKPVSGEHKNHVADDVEPQAASAGPTVDDMWSWLCDAATYEVEKWQAERGVALDDKAKADLAGLIAYCWTMGELRYVPGPLYRDGTEQTKWALAPHALAPLDQRGIHFAAPSDAETPAPAPALGGN